MSMRHLSIALLCALLTATSVRGAGVPYTGIVNRDGARVHSGPGEGYYATDTLRRGDRVEVYRIDEGGWCAIRPPAGSFTWVAAYHLRQTETPGVGEVIDDDVLTYVGSRIRKQRDAVQVRLNRGELIEVIGIDELPDEGTGQLQEWLRITPPAGEFRWIHLEYVDREPEPQLAQAAAAAPPPAAATSTASTSPTDERVEADGVPDVLPEADDDQAERAPSVAAVSRDTRQAKQAASRTSRLLAARWKPLPPGTLDKRAGRMAPKPIPTAESATAVATAQHEQTATPGWAGQATADRHAAGNRSEYVAISGAPPLGGAAPRLLGPVEAAPLPVEKTAVLPAGATEPSVATAASGDESSYEHQLAQLDVEFSLMVAQPASQWQLEPLMLRADQIARSATTPLTRGRARMLLEKMRQFEQLQNGSSPLGDTLVPDAGPGGQVMSAPPYSTPLPAPAVGYTPPPYGNAFAGRSAARFPNLLAALESLMPPRPAAAPPYAPGSGPAVAAPVPSRTLQIAPVSLQTPETAPPPPGSLNWEAAAEPAIHIPTPISGTDAAIGSGIAPGAESAWRTVSPAPQATGPGAPQATANAGNVLGQITSNLLYPIGGGQTGAVAADLSSAGYDGQGYLVPIVSRSGSAFADRNYMPPFALTDGDGNIVQFVTPAPGVNLHRYLRQEIGVFGQHRPLQHLAQPHVTASRVVALDRHRR